MDRVAVSNGLDGSIPASSHTSLSLVTSTPYIQLALHRRCLRVYSSQYLVVSKCNLGCIKIKLWLLWNITVKMCYLFMLWNNCFNDANMWCILLKSHIKMDYIQSVWIMNIIVFSLNFLTVKELSNQHICFKGIMFSEFGSKNLFHLFNSVKLWYWTGVKYLFGLKNSQ